MSRVLAKPEILLGDKGVSDVFKALKLVAQVSHYAHFRYHWSEVTQKSSSPLLCISQLSGLSADFIEHLRSVRGRTKAFLLFSGTLPPEAIVERVALLNVRNPERLHVVKLGSVSEQKKLLKRLFLALSSEDQHERIFDAWWEGEDLVVLSPRFKRLRVPLVKLRPLARGSKNQLQEFVIDSDGAFIHWPKLDVHLGMEQFVQAVDPAAYLKARQESRDFNERYGLAIRTFRQEHGLRQSDIAGLTPRQVGRIERGECRATHSALKKLAKAHKVNTSDYMTSIAALLA